MIQSIEQQMESARLAFDGALNHPELLSQLARYGYGREKVQEGKALYEKAKLLQNAHRKEKERQMKATEQLRAAFNEAHAVYIRHVKVARMAIPHKPEIWRMLELSGARDHRLSGWLIQADTFYAHVGKMAEAMAAFGVGADELAQAQAMIEAVTDARARQDIEIHQVQQAKLQRDQGLSKLQQWMQKFYKMARLAFPDCVEKLEILGIVPAS